MNDAVEIANFASNFDDKTVVVVAAAFATAGQRQFCQQGGRQEKFRRV